MEARALFAATLLLLLPFKMALKKRSGAAQAARA